LKKYKVETVNKQKEKECTEICKIKKVSCYNKKCWSKFLWIL